MNRTKCSALDCEKAVVAKGLCDMHYRRLLHHGTLKQTRPADWGKREDHPLYGMWTWQRRNGGVMVAEWRKDFWKFVADVGERPAEKHRVFRKFPDQPIGPNNFFWREPITTKEKDETQKEFHNRRMREYRAVNPERHKHYDLKKSFGITADDYARMLAEQNGVCAICGRPNETVIDRRTGQPRMLAVDHCHKTGKVRALLCQKCNQGIGCLDDDPARLRAAAAYVERHLEP